MANERAGGGLGKMTKRKSDGNTLRAVAVVNAAGRRGAVAGDSTASGADAVESGASADARPALASARKASEEARKSLLKT
jgi:NIMA (never in mitosis gene a)-related kinase